MLKLQIGCSREDVLEAVRQWIELLAQGDYEAAYALTFHDDAIDKGWIPQFIETLITNYGSRKAMRDGTK